MKPTALRDRFAELLSGFSASAATPDRSRDSNTDRFRNLLEEFALCNARSTVAEQKQAAADHDRFGALLIGYRAADEQYRRRQEAVAEDFNLLDVMQLTGKEIRHSMVLA